METTQETSKHIKSVCRLDMKDLTEFIICSGYERRLIQGASTLGSNYINWDDEWWGDFGESMVPLSAGGRLISPEELDPTLAQKMHCGPDEDEDNEDNEDEDDDDDDDEDEYEAGFWRKRNALPTKSVNPAPIEDLFMRYADENGDPTAWRDALATTRAQLYQEVREICKDSNNLYEIDNGLCLRLKDCFSPLSIGRWLKKQFYCGCFDYLPMGFTLIEGNQHKILIVEADGESG